MELYLTQKVKYYIILDPNFKNVEVYELIEGQYQPVAINPEKFNFDLHSDCSATAELLTIWD